MSILLGSQSPRRKEILEFFSLPFTQVHSDFDESQVPFQKDPVQFAQEVARQKALVLAKQYPQKIILTADTIVYKERELFLKPSTLAEAHTMLQKLSGASHQVFTGVCVAHGSSFFMDTEESRVFFHELTESQICTYHQAISPLDKAGAYAIQKGGSLIVKRIEGCYYNIMGLPIHTVRRLLLNVGIDLWDYLPSI